MGKKVYGLKRATGLMKIVHMNHIMDERARIAEDQKQERARKRLNEIMETCQQVRDLMETQDQYDEWWEAATEDGFLEAARLKLSELQAAPKIDSHYNGRQLTTPCPKCGGNLYIKERSMRIRGQAPNLSYFVGCANFTTTGCKYARSITTEDKIAMDSAPHVDLDLGI